MRTLISDLRSDKEVGSAFRFGDNIHCAGAREELDILGLKGRLEAKGHENITIEMIEPGIEDCFMALMKE
jgi:hypothetical protein